jgi:hypothetical protein
VSLPFPPLSELALLLPVMTSLPLPPNAFSTSLLTESFSAVSPLEAEPSRLMWTLAVRVA